MSQARTQRQRMLTNWLRDGSLGSQDEMVARLGEAGFVATQATVSRDLEELGATRVRRGGATRYVLAEELSTTVADARLDRLLAEWVLSIVAAGPLLVLKTPPGSANLVANAIDLAKLAEVAGTIAGDDTLFLALTDGVVAEAFAAMLRARRLKG